MISATAWPEHARHCLRVGSLSDKQIIEDAAAHFDVLVVQGNLAISAPQGIATWPLEKPIWIDPITYAFAASPTYLRNRNGEYKKTFVKLAAAFGSPYSEALAEDRGLAPADFETASIRREGVDRVLRWQEEVFASPAEDTKYGVTSVSPALLTIPFFPLVIDDLSAPTEPHWFRTNIAMIQEAAELRASHRLAAGFLAEPDVFDHPQFDAWLNAYADSLHEAGISHLWWWISDHDEVQTSLQRATRMLASFRMLAGRGIFVHQAFGGSLSSFALTSGLASVSHGVNYWESKGWEPIASGGLPTARYFHPELRERLRVPEAISIVDHRIDEVSAFYDRVCDCAVCHRVVADDLANFGAFGAVNIKTRRTRGGGLAEFDSPTPEALYLTKLHYLHAKGTEVALALSDDFTAPVQLQGDAAYWASDITRTRHLDRWAVALSLQS